MIERLQQFWASLSWGYIAFGVVLADNILVEFGNNLPGGKVFQ